MVMHHTGSRGLSKGITQGVAPTATELFFDGKTDEAVARLSQANPFGRLGEPREIAEVAAFLASPEGHWVNGQVVRSNGGMVL